MENNRKIRVAITHGDTNGIGYELIFKTFAAPEMLELCTPIIYGSPKVATYHRKALDIQANFSIINDASEARDGRVNLLTCFDEEIKVELGVPTPESNHAAMKALDRAISDYRNGLFDVLVTCPVDESNLESSGVKFESQQAYIESCLGDGCKALPMLINDNLCVALATNNLAMRDVPAAITPELIENRASLLYNTLRRDFRMSNPRVAVLSLNPNSAEYGNFGKEEQEIIIPVINKLAEAGENVFGPYAADELFRGNVMDAFDGILAMYHDQGIAPFKALEPSNGVSYLAGLAVVCTAPEDNVAFTIAGRNEADPASFRHAIFLAIDVFRHRQEYDEPLENPLKKLYHEKKDDSEKARFSIPKKHENSIIERAPRGNRNNDSAHAEKKVQADNKPTTTPNTEEQAPATDSEQ
ncbi:MAG: PdxA family dehydrogenase [Prevotella sp.]|jgi:4-hydroxythreonine-4-phosphate dehydrogenase